MKIEDFTLQEDKIDPKTYYKYQLVKWDVRYTIYTIDSGIKYLALVETRDEIDPRVFNIEKSCMVSSIEECIQFFKSN